MGFIGFAFFSIFVLYILLHFHVLSFLSGLSLWFLNMILTLIDCTPWSDFSVSNLVSVKRNMNCDDWVYRLSWIWFELRWCAFKFICCWFDEEDEYEFFKLEFIGYLDYGLIKTGFVCVNKSTILLLENFSPWYSILPRILLWGNWLNFAGGTRSIITWGKEENRMD